MVCVAAIARQKFAIWWNGKMDIPWDRRTPLVCAEPPPKGLTLVTYDRRTIPPLLKTWAEEERTHGGVVFVDEKRFRPRISAGWSGP